MASSDVEAEKFVVHHVDEGKLDGKDEPDIVMDPDVFEPFEKTDNTLNSNFSSTMMSTSGRSSPSFTRIVRK